MTQRCRGYVITPDIQGAHDMSQSVMPNSSGSTTISGPSLFLKYAVTFPFVENRRSHPVQGHCQSFEFWVPQQSNINTSSRNQRSVSMLCLSGYVIIRHHTSVYVRIRQCTSGYVRIRQDTEEYVSIFVRSKTIVLMWHLSVTRQDMCLSLLPVSL